MATVDVVARARAWLEADPDPVTRAELTELIDAGGLELERRFADRLDFGTAGLRGALGAGPTRMNRVIVRTTAAALAEVLDGPEGRPGPVVVGFDARRNSDVFADDTARVVAATDRDVVVLPAPLPTPVLAYAVRALGAAAGVMVTASHNPPADNGYKVYWGDGAQIVPPIDRWVSEAMDRIGLVSEAALAPTGDPRIRPAPDGLLDDYLDAVAGLRGRTDPVELTVVHSSMHGVGGETVRRAFARAGLPAPIPVPEQDEPDPDFPTVSFPNPEEPGAMDLLLALAEREGADLALANDPDADRLAVAVPARDGDGYTALSGNEIGWLLGHHVLSTTTGDDRLVSTSVVSSELLDRMAEHHGVAHHRTLTGFKWIVRPALADPSARLVFAYEEALGYLVGDVVLDKDGISAAVVFTELVARLRAEGRTVHDVLDELALRHGLHATDGWSVRFEGADGSSRMSELMARFRAEPPAELSGVAVTSVVDLAEADPPTDAVVFAGDGIRLTVRPSGTEPKIKLYAEVVVPVGDGDVASARRRAAETLTGLRAAITT